MNRTPRVHPTGDRRPVHEGRSSLYSWLTRIAMNSALMILRRRRTCPEIVVTSSSEEGADQLSLEVKDPGINPEQLYDIRQHWNHLSHAIRKLEPRLRAPVEIQSAEDLPLKEIAGALNVSVAAAKSRLYRARTRLAKRIHERQRVRAHRDGWSERGLQNRWPARPRSNRKMTDCYSRYRQVQSLSCPNVGASTLSF